MTIRRLTEDDTAQARALWQSAFDDPPAFVDWFFENRFLPEWSAGAFDGPELISVVHGTPMELTVGDGAFSALMTSGVATKSEDRGQGHMHAVMRFVQAEAEKRGISALFNHPQRRGAYAHLGFRASTFTKYWQGEGVSAPGKIVPFSPQKAFGIYTRISHRYSGFVCRDYDAFCLKMADYASDDAHMFMLEQEGEIVGYCVYFEKEDVWAEEVLSLTEYGPLLHELKRLAGDRRATAKLPPDANAPGQVLAQNVMLAPAHIWRAMDGSDRPCFCVDEY